VWQFIKKIKLQNILSVHSSWPYCSLSQDHWDFLFTYLAEKEYFIAKPELFPL